LWRRQTVKCKCIVGNWEDRGIERFLSEVLISHAAHRAEVRGHNLRQPLRGRTYNASDRVCVDSGMLKSVGRDVHEAVIGLRWCAEV
jgi:hypothetical protein